MRISQCSYNTIGFWGTKVKLFDHITVLSYAFQCVGVKSIRDNFADQLDAISCKYLLQCGSVIHSKKKRCNLPTFSTIFLQNCSVIIFAGK